MLRLIEEKDLSLVSKWRNSPEMREASLSQAEISPEEHLDWYKRDPSYKYLFEDPPGNPRGVVILSPSPESFEIALWSIYLESPGVAPGLGKKMALEGLIEAFKLGFKEVWAEVRQDNPRSLGFHRALGFKDVKAEGDFMLFRRELRDA